MPTQPSYIKIKEYKMKLIKPILTITALSSLIACSGGGGGGGGGGNDTAATAGSTASQTAGGTISGGSVSQASSINSASFAKVASTAEIVSNDSFMFKSSAKIAVDIVVPTALNNTDYLTICQGGDAATASVDYSQCILQTPIASQQFKGELTLSNDTLSLAIVLLDYDQPNKPYISFWSRADSPALITL
jgi:hypothetical protein